MSLCYQILFLMTLVLYVEITSHLSAMFIQQENSKENRLSYIMMEDSKDTIIVTGIGKDINNEEFVNHFKKIGDIIKSNMRTDRSQGIVQYAHPKLAKQAAETLNDSNLKGNVIRVEMADRFYLERPDGRNHIGEGYTAWELWSRENGGGGGKGGKGGRGGPNVPSGHDGEDGEPGPGGKGGAGGRPAVTNSSLGKRPYDWNQNGNNDPWYTRWFGIGGRSKEFENEYTSSSGGKGGKGGKAYGMKSGHDGEDGEAGPGGKGGRGGRPAL